MNETRSHQWSSMFLYSMLCIVFLGVLYVVVETFAPETSSEFIPRDDALSARFISSYRWGNANQDAQNSTLSTPLKEKNYVCAGSGYKNWKFKNDLSRIGRKCQFQNGYCYS